MAKVINQLLEQEMDRKEFLIRVGASALALTGVAGLIKALSGNNQVSNGYGSSTYGGSSKPRQ